ncbi:hypothetical protein GY45DRAFT_1330953 [Cubamyces sp. BRFM 1775]|nr:hypothetical protein GY45DRAFT_1330953 [Cubamyces sp. BRFM 1775]
MGVIWSSLSGTGHCSSPPGTIPSGTSAEGAGVWQVQPALEDRLMIALAKRGIDGRATWIDIILEDWFPCSVPPCCQLQSPERGRGRSVEMKRTLAIHIIWLVTSRRQENASTRKPGLLRAHGVRWELVAMGCIERCSFLDAVVLTSRWLLTKARA